MDADERFHLGSVVEAPAIGPNSVHALSDDDVNGRHQEMTGERLLTSPTSNVIDRDHGARALTAKPLSSWEDCVSGVVNSNPTDSTVNTKPPLHERPAPYSHFAPFSTAYQSAAVSKPPSRAVPHHRTTSNSVRSSNSIFCPPMTIAGVSYVSRVNVHENSASNTGMIERAMPSNMSASTVLSSPPKTPSARPSHQKPALASGTMELASVPNGHTSSNPGLDSPPISLATSPVASSIFTTSTGRRLGFFIPFGVYGRVELCRKIKANGGTVQTSIRDCDYILVTRTEVPLVQSQATGSGKPMMATWWITACVVKRRLLPLANYEFGPIDGSHIPPTKRHGRSVQDAIRLPTPSSDEEEILIVPNSNTSSRSGSVYPDHHSNGRLPHASERAIPSSDAGDQIDEDFQDSSEDGNDDDNDHVVGRRATPYSNEEFERAVKHVAQHPAASLQSRAFWTPFAKGTTRSAQAWASYARRNKAAIQRGVTRLQNSLPFSWNDCTNVIGSDAAPLKPAIVPQATAIPSAEEREAEEQSEDNDGEFTVVHDKDGSLTYKPDTIVPKTQTYTEEDFWKVVRYSGDFGGADVSKNPGIAFWTTFQKDNPTHTAGAWYEYGRKWRKAIAKAVNKYRAEAGGPVGAAIVGSNTQSNRAHYTEEDYQDVIDYIWTKQPANITAAAIWRTFAKDHPNHSAKAWNEYVRRHEHTRIRPDLEERRREMEANHDGNVLNQNGKRQEWMDLPQNNINAKKAKTHKQAE